MPEVLLSGHHARIARHRREEALRRTLDRRPDLLETAELDLDDRRLVERLRAEASGRAPAGPPGRRSG